MSEDVICVLNDRNYVECLLWLELDLWCEIEKHFKRNGGGLLCWSWQRMGSRESLKLVNDLLLLVAGLLEVLKLNCV